MDNSSRTEWSGCTFNLAAVTCALHKLQMMDSDMNPDVTLIENFNRKLCNAWDRAAWAGLVSRRGCFKVGLKVRVLIVIVGPTNSLNDKPSVHHTQIL